MEKQDNMKKEVRMVMEGHVAIKDLVGNESSALSRMRTEDCMED